MKTLTLTLAVALGLSAVLLPVAYSADDKPAGQHTFKEQFRNMTPEQRREAWANLPEEQKQKLREMHHARKGQEKPCRMSPEEKRAKWESLSDEDKAKYRERMRQHRHQGGGEGASSDKAG